VTYKLLGAFEGLFSGVKYIHRNSTQGDLVASFLVDDLYQVRRSLKLVQAVDSGHLVLNTRNKTVGLSHRRGDGTFGSAIPGVPGVTVSTYSVKLGEVAEIRIGAEVKVMAKAMIKQLDRVGTDMLNQADQFRRHGNNPICVGIVAINYADAYRSFEGDREWPTDGRRYKHPIQEAAEAEATLLSRVQGTFDELLCLRYKATNLDSFPFAWCDEAATIKEYGASLVRISSMYDRRF
jgi:hypothetical protein